MLIKSSIFFWTITEFKQLYVQKNMVLSKKIFLIIFEMSCLRVLFWNSAIASKLIILALRNNNQAYCSQRDLANEYKICGPRSIFDNF